MDHRASITGLAATPFGAVRDAFRGNFTDGLELGAHFAAFVEGECVVDLIGGFADRKQETLWSDETIACVYSSGKAAIALLFARAASAGQIDYDAPVAAYWPEFGVAGKEGVTIADAMSHQAGLCGLPDEMPPEDWLNRDRICARIAAMAPLWPPRSASGYSPQLFGFLADEILRRATGRSIARMLREDFHEQRGLDLFCGLREAEISRAAYMPKPPQAPDLGELNLYTRLAFLKPWSAPARVSRDDWMAAELPASNTHANARALAEIVHPFADRGRFRSKEILTVDAIEDALTERIRGDDLVLPFNISWSASLMRNIAGHFGPSQTAFGHAGFGGSCVMFDPAHRLSAAYVMNKMSPHLVGDPRAVRLIRAIYDAL